MSELLKTKLYETHGKLGAKFAGFAGFDMPIQYTSIKDECFAVRNNAGVFDVSHMGEFFVLGPEAIKFVDFLLPNDFAGAEVGKAVYSPLCREDGTLIDDLIAYKLREDKVLICVNAANIKKDWDWISLFAKDFNIQLVDHSEKYSLLALQGPKSVEILKGLEVYPNDDFDYYSAVEKSSPYGEIILARTGYTGEDGFEIFCKHDDIEKLWADLLKREVTPCGLAARDVLRLEVCYPLFGHELKDHLTPLDCGLKWTVKLDKDDFVGKQALSDYKPGYRLIKLSLEKGIPREGYPITNDNGDIIGEVTSGTMSPQLSKGICLGLIKKDQFPENKKFAINVRKNNIPAAYQAKAFVKGGHL